MPTADIHRHTSFGGKDRPTADLHRHTTFASIDRSRAVLHRHTGTSYGGIETVDFHHNSYNFVQWYKIIGILSSTQADLTKGRFRTSSYNHDIVVLVSKLWLTETSVPSVLKENRVEYSDD